MIKPTTFRLGIAVMIAMGSAAFPIRAQQPATAFVHVSVVPMDRERVLKDQTVVVQGDRIVALGPAKQVPVPAGATQVDGKGKFLIPGLADMHAHINYLGDSTSLLLYAVNGVTTVRDMFGRPGALQLRDMVAKGELLGPRVYAVGIDEECPKDKPLATCLADMKAAGDLMVKIYWDSLARFDSIVTIGRQLNLPVGGHVSPWVGLERSLDVPYSSLEHLWGYFESLVDTRPSLMLDMFKNADTVKAILDTAQWMKPGYRVPPERLRAIAERTRRAGTWNVPTLVVREGMVCRGKADTVKIVRMGDRMLEVGLQVVKALQGVGAGLLLATDMTQEGGGFAVHRELELMVLAGLTPYQALATGTTNVAAYLKTEDSTGTVAVGKRADLVLIDGNPLKDIRYTAGPAGVMLAGRWLPRTELDARFDDAMGGSRRSDGGSEYRRMHDEALLHKGIQVSRGDSTSSAAGLPDVCRRLQSGTRAR